MKIYQEAVDLSRGANFLPMKMRYRLPMQKENVDVFLLSDSFEYDIELIKKIPQPKMDYKHISIIKAYTTKVGIKPFRYRISMNEYARKVQYLNSQKTMSPKLIPFGQEYVNAKSPVTIKDNSYISLSDIIPMMTPFLRNYSKQYIQEHIFELFKTLMPMGRDTKIVIIDTSRYKIYKNPSMDSFMSDMINALLAAYIFNPIEKINKLDYIFIFRAPECDYKMDLSLFEKRDVERMKTMLRAIGVNNETSAKYDDDVAASSNEFTDRNEIDDMIDEIDDDSYEDKPEVDPEVKRIQAVNDNATSSIKDSLNELAAKYGKTQREDVPEDDQSKLYNIKTLDINATLLKRINPSTDIVSNYKRLSEDISPVNNAVEKRIADDAAKKLASEVAPSDEITAINATTSAREKQIREQVGKVKLNNISFNTLTSVTDVPLPKPLQPLHITTTNSAALKGSGFPMVSQEYEDKLLDRDIVATFMNFSKLPDGFYVTNVEVTDISTVTSLMNNWKITLRNKLTERQSIINLRIPKVINGRFYDNGVWYTIGKQDFPIPILKINKKTVILTSNYNKITCTRYDTRSLVDLGMLVKVIEKTVESSGTNKYVKVGNSSSTNARFVSTIEYDEFARRWVYFKNKEANVEIYFNRVMCEKAYSFVTVQPNEFCCGMINQVPIVVNTETGLTRKGVTLTDTILETLPENLRNEYRKQKPGKMSMYSEITIGVTIPLGVAIAAWEGLGSLLKKSNAKYQYVDKSFNDTKYFIIPFKDKKLAIESNINNQLIFNGFYRINTKAYNVSDFEIPIMNTNSIYVDIFNQLFFKQYSQLTTFITYYNFFVDPITSDVCNHYHIPNDIAGMLIYASNLLADNNHISEHNSALYRIRSTEIIPGIIHYELAVAISKYNNNVGSKSRGNALTINPNQILNRLRAVPIVGTSSALNPMVELHGNETISKKGYVGVNNERAFTVEKRSYEESMIGKIAMSSPNSANVGVSRQIVVDPKIESVRGYTSTAGPETNFNDFQLASFSELLTPGTVSRDDAIRNAIATSQTSHIVPTEAAQPVLISNGMDELVPSYLSEEFSYVARDDGKVLEIADDYMIIQYKSGKRKAINIGHTTSFNSGSGFYVDNKLTANFEAGQSFKRGEILAYHEKFFSKDSDGIVRMNIGPLSKVAFAGLYSTYEDAGLVTMKMSKKLESKLTMKEMTKINATDDIESIVKVGTEVEVGDPLIVFGLGDTGDKSVDNFLKAFQTSKDKSTSALDSAKRVIRAKNAGTVVAVKMYTVKSMDKLSPSLFNIFDEYFKENIKKRRILDKYDKTSSVYKLDTLYELPTEPLKGSTIKGITCDVLVEIYIEHADEASVGDKLVAYGASKQVLSEVVPEGLEPYSETRPDEEISIFVSPSCVLKRMIPSLVITSSGNKVLVELKRSIRKLWESE